MPLLLRKATPADAQALTEIYLSAFSTDAISVLVFPRSSPGSYKFWHDSILEEIADPLAHFLLIYDSSHPDNLPVSYCKWNSPPSPTSPPQPNELPQWPQGANIKIANNFFGELMRRKEKIMGGRRYWYLEIVATRKEYQGQGAAGQLLRWGLERCDEDGVEAYLEASPEGVPVYGKYGFGEVERLVVDLEKDVEGWKGEKEFVEVFMVRPGKGVKEKD